MATDGSAAAPATGAAVRWRFLAGILTCTLAGLPGAVVACVGVTSAPPDGWSVRLESTSLPVMRLTTLTVTFAVAPFGTVFFDGLASRQLASLLKTFSASCTNFRPSRWA